MEGKKNSYYWKNKNTMSGLEDLLYLIVNPVRMSAEEISAFFFHNLGKYIVCTVRAEQNS